MRKGVEGIKLQLKFRLSHFRQTQWKKKFEGKKFYKHLQKMNNLQANREGKLFKIRD